MLMVVLLAALVVSGAGMTPELSRDGKLVINGSQLCDDNPASDAPPCIYLPFTPFVINAGLP